MLGTIWLVITGFISFSYITLRYLKKVREMEKVDEFEAVKFAREKLKIFTDSNLFALNIKLKVTYEDKEAFDKVDPRRGVVFISNHMSNLDIPVLMKAIPTDIGFIAKKEMADWPFYGTWMPLGKSVFLDRENPREGIKAIKKGIETVKEGHPMVIFPQGNRTVGFGEGEFKKGSFKLATESEGFVVPVTIIGTDEIQKPGEKVSRRGKEVTVHIGKPIFVPDLSEEEIKTLYKRVEDIIRVEYNRDRSEV